MKTYLVFYVNVAGEQIQREYIKRWSRETGLETYDQFNYAKAALFDVSNTAAIQRASVFASIIQLQLWPQLIQFETVVL